MEAENIIVCIRTLRPDSDVNNLLKNCVVDQFSRSQSKDLSNIYLKLFKIHACNKLEPMYAMKLLDMMVVY